MFLNRSAMVIAALCSGLFLCRPASSNPITHAFGVMGHGLTHGANVVGKHMGHGANMIGSTVGGAFDSNGHRVYRRSARTSYYSRHRRAVRSVRYSRHRRRR